MKIIFYEFYFYFLLIIFGSSIGSFLNVVIYRIPKENFFSEKRSYCPICEEKLKWYDIIPVISYIFLKGHCKYCKSKISPRYFVIEITGAVLAVLCFLRFGLSLKFILTFGISAILLAISAIDFAIMEIPDSLIIALIPLSICSIFIWNDIMLKERIIGFFIISLPLLLITFIINGAFGGGDIKLTAVSGFLLGWENMLPAFFIALLLGGTYAMFLLVFKKSKTGVHIAFGPYICAGIFVSLFYGKNIIEFYLSFINY